MSAPSPDAVLHLAALHTLAATGFASTSRAASVTLSSTLARYLRLVAVTCTERASLAGRSKVAAIDVLQALEELGVGGVGELHEWTAELDQEVCLSAPGLGALNEDNKEGLAVEEAIARMKLVPMEEAVEDESDDEDMAMDLDETAESMLPPKLGFDSPDFAWLPPLPNGEPLAEPIVHEPSNDTGETVEPVTASAGSLSIIDRYRRRIPFASSQLASARPFVDPPRQPLPPLPTASTSFPALATAFAATRGEPSIALRQTPLRQQATELLRRNLASPNEYSPDDTLPLYLPGPRVTPVVPSHSDSPDIHANPIPLNPNPSGLLSRMVHTMHSSHLPPHLRDRLTSVRPPQPQYRDGKVLLYGEPVRGPGEAALARARGKAAEADQMDPGLLQATWMAPARGQEKWAKRLPTGKKVLQSGAGEDCPRVPAGSRPAVTPGNLFTEVKEEDVEGLNGDAPTPGGSTTSKIKLRLTSTSLGAL